MAIENILQPNTVTLIKEVGFPITSFIIMVSILMHVMKRDALIQERTEARYEKLVDKFIETTKGISDQHEKTMKDITSELKSMTSELKIITTKVDTYTNIIDNELEARSLAYVFKGEEKKFKGEEKGTV